MTFSLPIAASPSVSGHWVNLPEEVLAPIRYSNELRGSLLMVTGIWMQWIYQIQSLAGTFITPV